MVDTASLAALAASHRLQGLQAGSQVFVSVGGAPIVHFADGDSAEGHPLKTSTILRWYEAGMPLLAILMGRLLESERVHLDDRVEKFIPGWGNGKESCTIRHLLTHMGGFAGAELADRDISHREAIEQISAYRAEYLPGTKAGFHPSSGWRVLAEIIESVEKKPVTKLITKLIFKPIGLKKCAFTHLEPRMVESLGSSASPVHWAGYTVDTVDENGESIAVSHAREVIHNTGWHVSKWEPAMSSWGSAAALGRIYEGLLDGAKPYFDQPSTVDLLTAAHRVSVKDRTFGGAPVPWGLGFQVAASFGGSVGYRAFGHTGLTGRAICDPEDRLVMVYLTNGLASRIDHERRITEMMDAIYEVVMPRSTGAWITTSLPAVGVD
jgi:CubicO group peptidase (beta-lactamase class C family)